MADIEVLNDVARNEYVILVDGERAGLAAYRISGGRRIFDHTEISKEFGGQGLGSALVEGALTQARESGEPIVPVCPFIANYIRKHGEWRDIVGPGALDRLDQPATD